MTALDGLFAVAGLAAGAALGGVHFTLLAIAVRLHAGRGGTVGLVGLHLVRFLPVVTGFCALAQTGALALLCGLAGFTAVRLALRDWFEERLL